MKAAVHYPPSFNGVKPSKERQSWILRAFARVDASIPLTPAVRLALIIR
jgi:hypothetical protein